MADPIRIVLVGCGGISNAWWNAVKENPEVQIVGLVDLNEEAARRKRDDWGLPAAAIGTDLGEMLADQAPEAVFNCTVPPAHTDVTLTALAHGCHILGEKPLTESLPDARRLLAAAQQAQKTFAVIQNRRYSPNIRALQRHVHSGAIGRITTVNSDFYIGAHFGGFRDAMNHVLLLDMAIHSFDQARMITGADPVSVYCHEWNPSGSWYAHGASAVCIFEMTGGIVYTYRGSWCSEGMNTSWQCNWRVQGETGCATWNGETEFAGQHKISDEGFTREQAADSIDILPCPGKEGGHTGNINEFLRCIRSGETPETHAADNIKSLAMVLGAIESAETGKKVAITV